MGPVGRPRSKMPGCIYAPTNGLDGTGFATRARSSLSENAKDLDTRAADIARAAARAISDL